MGISDFSLNLYRKTLKRFRPAHVATHWVMHHGAIPFLEKSRDFRTMPDDPFWFRMELLTQKHEPETMRVLDGLVQPGMTMLDVGAHVGYYACRYAPMIGAHGRIFAFEPHPRTFATLGQNVQKWVNVTAVQAALADREGTAELHDYLMMSASGSLHYDEEMVELQQAQMHEGDVAPRIGQTFTPQTFTVRTMPADIYLAEQGIDRVDIIKMDIEGAEITALRGMKETIARSPQLKLVMEYNPAALKAFGHDPEGALAEVLAMGFTQVQAIEPDGRLTDWTGQHTAVQQQTAQLLTRMGVVNLLFS
jgi:FkbM family methyltransferase